MAKEKAYLDGSVKCTYVKSQKELDNLTEAPLLDESYQQAAREVAARRLVLAGYRLADQLKAIFAEDP